MGEAHVRDISKCKAQLSYCLILAPYFENALTLRLYPTPNDHVNLHNSHVAQVRSGRLNKTCLLFKERQKRAHENQYVLCNVLSRGDCI